MSLPTDVALALSSAGISTTLPDDELAAAIRSAIADRGGYLDTISVTDIGFQVELLAPEGMTFEGRSPELALAWCLIYLLGERGEIGVSSFAV